MPVEINTIDTFQTRVFNSYVNLTKQDSTKYPATTTCRIEPCYLPPEALDGATVTDLLTSYTIYDQFALRVWSTGSPLSAK
jgi:hypothetical protein